MDKSPKELSSLPPLTLIERIENGDDEQSKQVEK